MDWTVTLSVAAVATAVAGFAGWRGARPSNPARGVRLVPWRFVMVLAAAIVLLALVHAANMMGIETGRR